MKTCRDCKYAQEPVTIEPCSSCFYDEKCSNWEPKMQSVTGPTPQHYRYSYKGIKLDPYRILLIYKVTHPAHQHAIKKLLRAGAAHKDLRQDLKEVIDSLNRWVEMLDEDDAG